MTSSTSKKIFLLACLIAAVLCEFKVVKEKIPVLEKFAEHFQHKDFKGQKSNVSNAERLNIHLIPHSHDDVGKRSQKIN